MPTRKKTSAPGAARPRLVPTGNTRKIRFTVQIESPRKSAVVTISWFAGATDITYQKSGVYIEDLAPNDYDYILHGRLLLGDRTTVTVDDITDLAAVKPLIPPQVYDTAVISDTCGYQVS